ncbi:MAG: HEAT repeat domain-containing protein [Verrucomicrobiota bacterium]
MFRVLISLLAIFSLAGCSRPGDSEARRAHELLEAGRFEEARTLIDTSLKETPDSSSLRQERLHLALLLGQPEIAAGEAAQMLRLNPKAQPYRRPLEDRLPAVRANALKALALDPPARPAPASLIKAGLKDPDPTVRREAAEATRILDSKEAIKILRVAAKDQDWLTRATAARLFGQRGDPSLIPDLFAMIQDADSYVRRFARRSLLELAEKAKPESYLPSLKSPDRTTQIVAALALVRLNDGRGAEVLLAEIANPLGIERVECVKAVSKLVDPRIVPALRTSASDKDSEVRVVSLIALGLLKDKDSAPLLKKISADPASPKEVKLAAAKALDLLTRPTDQP